MLHATPEQTPRAQQPPPKGGEAGRSPPAPQICPLPDPAVPPPQLLPGAAIPQLPPHFSPGRCPQICNVTPRTCQRPQKCLRDKETRIKAGLQFPRVVFLPSPGSSPEQAFMGSLRALQIILRSPCAAQNVTLLTMISPAVAMEIAILPCTRVFFFLKPPKYFGRLFASKCQDNKENHKCLFSHHP